MKAGLVIAGGSLVVIGAAGYYYYNRQITALENTQYKVIGIKVDQMTGNQAVVELTLRLTSQSTIEAEIVDFYFEVFLGQSKVATLTPKKSFTLPAMGYTDIQLNVQFSPRLLALDAVTLLTAYLNKKDLGIRVVGNVKIKSAVFALPGGTRKVIPIYVTATVPIEYDSSIQQQLSSPT